MHTVVMRSMAGQVEEETKKKEIRNCRLLPIDDDAKAIRKTNVASQKTSVHVIV